MSPPRRAIAVAALAAFGAVTPLIAHALGASCWIYLPAHVPALLAGLALGPVAGFVTGAATAVSDLLWGGRVHGVAFLPIGLELVTYGLCAGLLSARADRYGPRVIALGGAMLAGRVVHFAVALLLGREPWSLFAGLFVHP